MRGLGWNILRVWSTDWWYDAKGATERLHQALTALLEESRQVPPVDEAENIAGDMALPVSEIRLDGIGEGSAGDDTIRILPASVEADPVPAGIVDMVIEGEGMPMTAVPVHSIPVMAADGPAYRIADLSGYRAEPDNFFEFSYRATIRSMVEAIVEAEAPLREDVLAQKIARAHGWFRTGARIRERIALHLKEIDRTEESSGAFVWKKGTVCDFLPYRSTIGAEPRRAISDIPLAELASIVRAQIELLDETDPPLALARLLGVERLAATSRGRLEEAIVRARGNLGAE